MCYFLSALLAFIAVFPVFADEDPHINPQALEEVLKGNWVKAASSFSAQEMQASPVARLLSSHTLMAVNNDNYALVLMTSVNDSDLKSWLEWSRSLPESPIAHFFLGDALARSGQYDAAMAAYDKALSADSGFAPALVGKALIYSSRQDKENARRSIEQAVQLAPKQVLAHLAYGHILLQFHAAKGAQNEFETALTLSHDSALAFNGLGCAYYGQGRFEDAEEKFAAAYKQVPLPLFVGNDRAVAATNENLLLGPELKNSPLFRVLDFLDYPALHARTEETGDLMHEELSGKLPVTLDVEALSTLNQVLTDPGLLAKVRSKQALPDSNRLRQALAESEPLLNQAFASLTPKQQASVRLLNRILLEELYPKLIAHYDQRDPGFQLSIANGQFNFGSQMDYKHSLSNSQIIAGQARMDYIYRPLANVLSATGAGLGGIWGGGLSLLASQWNNHLDQSTRTNSSVLDSRNHAASQLQPGGVTADLREAFIAESKWPVDSGMAQLLGKAGEPLAGRENSNE